jgi:hypothetical protein
MMENEVSEFMGGIHAAVLGGFGGVEKHIGPIAIPHGEGIDLTTLFDQGENDNSMSLEEVDHVGNCSLTQSPLATDGLSCRLRVDSRKLRNVGFRQRESVSYP